MRARDSVAVVIPVLDETEQLRRNLPAVLSGSPAEVIVVDGGSTDDSADIARSLGATVLSAEQGRGRQLNAGARAVCAEYLLFLHADTRPPPGYVEEVVRLLRQPGVGVGAFRFTVDAPEWRYRVLEACVRLRCRILRLPYGDQGLFMRRDWWARGGGFPESEMEDLKLVWASRSSAEVVLSPALAVTSARRWARHGLFRVSLANVRALVRFLLTKNDTEPSSVDARQSQAARTTPSLAAQVTWERAR